MIGELNYHRYLPEHFCIDITNGAFIEKLLFSFIDNMTKKMNNLSQLVNFACRLQNSIIR